MHPKQENESMVYSLLDDSMTTLKTNVTQQNSLCIGFIFFQKEHYKIESCGRLTLGDKNKLEMSELVWNVTQMYYAVITVHLTDAY